MDRSWRRSTRYWINARAGGFGSALIGYVTTDVAVPQEGSSGVLPDALESAAQDQEAAAQPGAPAAGGAGGGQCGGWVDFMSDSLYNGRRFRTLNVLDEGVREALAIEIDTNLPARRVVRLFARLVELRGTHQAITVQSSLRKCL